MSVAEPRALSYSECKIPHWSLQTPQLHNGFSPCYVRRKTGTPKILLDTALIVENLNMSKVQLYLLFPNV